jgi:hypothetical protein
MVASRTRLRGSECVAAAARPGLGGQGDASA